MSLLSRFFFRFLHTPSFTLILYKSFVAPFTFILYFLLLPLINTCIQYYWTYNYRSGFLLLTFNSVVNNPIALVSFKSVFIFRFLLLPTLTQPNRLAFSKLYSLLFVLNIYSISVFFPTIFYNFLPFPRNLST